MTGQMIQRFQLEGEFDDNSMIKVKENAIRILTGIMKDQGFVPVLDLNETWLTRLVGTKFEYRLILQGVHVGVDKAWDYAGVTNGKPVPSSPKSK